MQNSIGHRCVHFPVSTEELVGFDKLTGEQAIVLDAGGGRHNRKLAKVNIHAGKHKLTRVVALAPSTDLKDKALLAIHMGDKGDWRILEDKRRVNEEFVGVTTRQQAEEEEERVVEERGRGFRGWRICIEVVIIIVVVAVGYIVELGR